MNLAISIVVGVLFAVSVYLVLGRELKEVCMGLFLLGHAVNLAIIAAGRSPTGNFPPVLGEGPPVERLVDPLPQALVLTAVVIGFAVQAFLLTLIVATWRRAGSLDVAELCANPADALADRSATKPDEAMEAVPS